jgi:IS30 family transposase
MSRRGRKRRLAVEDEYWRLIGSGVGTVEACRRVGIGRRTGYRWRAEHGGACRRLVSAARRAAATSLCWNGNVSLLFAAWGWGYAPPHGNSVEALRRFHGSSSATFAPMTAASTRDHLPGPLSRP